MARAGPVRCRARPGRSERDRRPRPSSRPASPRSSPSRDLGSQRACLRSRLGHEHGGYAGRPRRAGAAPRQRDRRSPTRPGRHPRAVSSSGRPGDCITPSTLTWFSTTIRLIDRTRRRRSCAYGSSLPAGRAFRGDRGGIPAGPRGHAGSGSGNRRLRGGAGTAGTGGIRGNVGVELRPLARCPLPARVAGRPLARGICRAVRHGRAERQLLSVAPRGGLPPGESGGTHGCRTASGSRSRRRAGSPTAGG